jgi:thiol-disulfide isomerase/thioredoxin
MRRVWQSRWARAAAAAVLVAMWPACATHPDDPDATAGPVDGDLEYADLDFTLKNLQGEDVSLADYLGRPIIINFWATWCAPCKHEIPTFISLVEKYREDGFVVVGISTDDAIEDLEPFVREFGINYPVLLGLGRDDVLDAYAAGYFVPTSWFIRRDGSVALKWPGTQTPEWFEEQVAALLAEPTDDTP